MASAFRNLLSFPSRHPFVFGVSLTAVKTGTVDLLVQKYAEKREQIDWCRNAVFVTFGITYMGAWQYLLFVKIMPKLVPGAASFAAKGIADKLRDGPGVRGLLIQTFVENGINNPLLYFPIFYTIKEFLEGEGNVETAMIKWRKNMWEDLRAIWAVWVPAQLINFAFSPMWFRLGFGVG